ncbi:MAG: aldehyde dehydrogenase family protein [Actinomycetales bacterium]|nr:aldehyde dehydrogenase family protein [Actinomycetales bacterium]
MTPDPALVERLLSSLEVSGAPVAVTAPFTGAHAYDVAVAEDADVDRAVATLRAGQRMWAQRPLSERTAILLKFHDLVLARRDQGLDIVQWETGKARKDAMEELLDVCITARHYARDAKRLLRPRQHRGVFPGAVGVTQYQQPKGVVGFLTPWNYPLTIGVSDAIPALIAGNAALIKPDVQTTLTALWAVDLLVEAGLPRDVVQVVPGEGPRVGPLVIDRVDYVMFTGSTRVGREVAARCGERLIGCSLELGGKNAMIVRADADPERAAEIAVRGSFSNAGQLCISMERIYVHHAVYEAFRDAFVARVRGLEFARGIGWPGQMGSLISARQRDRVQQHVEDARSRGARVLVGGSTRPDLGPHYFEPTVLEGVTEGMILCDEETFGPVVALYRVHSDEEAIRLANATAYGLNAAVVTRDRRQGRTVALRLHAGTVNINEAYGPSWGSTRAPMGGMGDSGLGRRHGDEGLLKYTESQTVAAQRILGFGPPFGWSDERWTETLATAFSVMKRLGLK